MISFVSKDYKPPSTVTPRIEFFSEDGFEYATIYIDHVAVAYFNELTGGLTLLELEVGPYTGGDESEKVRYLEDRGFQLDKKDGHAENYYFYTIKVG